jgi:diguanylate cyclase
MSYEERVSSGTGGNRLLRIFGFGSRESGHGPSFERPSLHDERAALVAAIGDFLLLHELAISAENLDRAHGIVTGINRSLAGKVRLLENSGQPVTQAWLDEQQPHDRGAHEQASELDQLAKSMASSVTRFGETSRTAQQAASKYGRDLQAHVAAVEETSGTEDVIANLTQIARAMLDRTREMEEEMRASELESRQLRRSLEKARHDATVDHLTGLPNRRAFEEVFAEEKLAAQNELEPLCVALCDIDFFKKVNDTHGHETGDRVIRAVGQALDRISDRCHVARHGGEEFALLFRGLDLSGAKDALDAARERFASRHFVDKVSGNAIGGVTFSGGVVNVFAHGDLSDALRAADEALYRAKEAGRNRIEMG